MDEQERKSRLRTLHIVLALSLITNGLNALSYFTLSFEGVRNMMQNNMQLIPEVMQESYDFLLSIPSSFYLVSSLFYIIAFVGCLIMWRPRGIGFHYYTLAKLLLIGTPLVFIGRQYFNLGDLMMSLLFIAYYLISLRSLGAFSKSEPDSSEDSDNTDTTDLPE
ncbi:MAG: hypothetical protein K5867_01425 [Bacteroidales bacterium]|nr:hypothetical protein [Bacteroidales bacterium]